MFHILSHFLNIMRTYLILSIFFLLFPLSVFTQQHRSYWVHLKNQINRDSLQLVFEQNRMHSPQRAALVLQAFSSLRASTGNSVLERVEQIRAERPADISEVERHHIVNGFIIRMNPELLFSLNEIPEVDYVEDVTDLRFFLMNPVRMEEQNVQQRALGAAEPGLVAVGARDLWSLGYTGKGVKILSFDTGIWPEHPSLGGRFYGEFVPLRFAWNGIWSQFPADKSSSHGTHTVGTMAGLDTATADTIGLAFKAYFMATDPIVSDLADTIGAGNLMACYEWALDPDGNPATTGDMPDVICNSWGTAGNVGFCGSFVADMLAMVDLAGIANEYSAGNNGPSPTTVGLPALVNPGLLNAFAVGAVNGNVPGFPIASFSSRGPSPCLGGGSLEIKPEVVAPGVDVRSCVKKNSYAFFDGTSMAGPHVAGVLALLKEAFPDLPGETLKAALYYSASDLGDPGEDNTYGMGIIQAGAAYQWLLNEGYSPVPPSSSVPELAIEKPLVGMLDLHCEAGWTPTLSIYNEGIFPIQDTVFFSVELNGNATAGWAQFITLNPQQRMQVSAPQSYTLQLGANEIWISARQKNVPVEKDMINNNRTFRFERVTEIPLPYTWRFEGDSLTAEGWRLINGDMLRTFEKYTTAGQDSGVRSAAMRFVLYAPAESQPDYLISPLISVPAGNNTLAFDAAHQLRASNAKDSLFVVASSDCGFSFPHVLFAAGASQLATVTGTTPTNFVPSLPEHWKRWVVPIPASLSGQSLLFAFLTKNRKGGNLFIDDFSVFPQFDPLESVEQYAPKPELFPNPFTDGFQIRFTSEAVGLTLHFFDVQGRRIFIQYTQSGSSIYVEPGEVPAGIYFMKITSDTGTSVFRVIRSN